jgi:hypothetical protein
MRWINFKGMHWLTEIHRKTTILNMPLNFNQRLFRKSYWFQLLALLLAIVLNFCALNLALADDRRIALVIGNSKYQELGTLKNTINDAKGISSQLSDLGYKVTMLTDANEISLRRAVRRFAADSENASVSVIYYAGHGAQIQGENYILPTDLDIPQRESDIQLSSLKVDDLINSVKSKIKVIFLDACRDNPVLIRSLSKGRGSFRGGLAPARETSIETSSNGVFIAYATDAGNVALDGENQNNSPFTTALIKHIKQPVSIDDMFSLVTRDVRAATKNSQKPYKYASLDGIFCLTNKCGSLNQEVKSNTQQPLDDLSKININSGNQNWVLFNSAGENYTELWFIDNTSISKYENRTWFNLKILQDKDNLKAEKKRGQYSIHQMVIDCKRLQGSIVKLQDFSEQGVKLKDSSFGDPRSIDLNFDYSNNSTIGFSIAAIACDEEKYKNFPTVAFSENDGWTKFFSLPTDIDIYFKQNSVKRDGNFSRFLAGYKFLKESNSSKLESFYGMGLSKINNNFQIKHSITHLKFDCINFTTQPVIDQAYSDNNMLIMFTGYQEHINKPEKIIPTSAFDQLFKLVCK